ncbi:MAG: hypothetical protein K6G22_03025 [Lachnospiraceae bacterium]|nr:hypothetical protein [Lachnospiraceae bacterium]
MAMSEDEKNERLGRAAVGITWFIFAAKFIVIATLIAGVILYIAGKPLWLAPVTGIALFIAYRLIWRLVWMIIGRISRQ